MRPVAPAAPPTTAPAPQPEADEVVQLRGDRACVPITGIRLFQVQAEAEGVGEPRKSGHYQQVTARLRVGAAFVHATIQMTGSRPAPPTGREGTFPPCPRL